MKIGNTSSAIDIAVSGMRARAAQMNAIASNIANSRTTRTASGNPYRRQEVIFSTDDDGFGGVRIDSIGPDMSTDFKRVYQPGHPDADKTGHVLMPNVDTPIEMINMVMASRAYQANAAVLKRYQEIVNVAIELLK